MTGPVSREEFGVLTNDVAHIKSDVSEMKTDTKGLVTSQQDFIKAQTKHNTEAECHKDDYIDFKKNVRNVAFLILGLFSSSAGIGFYASLPDKPQEETKETPALVSINHE